MGKHLPKAFIETYQTKKLTGIPKETQFVLPRRFTTPTNSKQVCSVPRVDSAIPENFHGFGADVARFNP